MNPFQAPVRPGRLQIEITTGCNLRCAGCQRTPAVASGTWVSRHMPAERFAAVLGHCPPAAVLVLQGIGEPTLHPDLPELIAIARRDGRFPLISFNTNALVRDVPYYAGLRAAGLAHLSVSVDSLNPVTAERLRAGTDTGLLRARLGGLVAAGFAVTASVVLSRINLPELPDLLDALAALRVPVIEVQPLIDYGGAAAGTALDADGLARGLAEIRAAAARHPGLSVLPAPALTPNGGKCRRPLHALYVTVDGLLTPCCVTDDAGLFGRTGVTGRPFSEVWHSPAVARWFEGFLDGEPEICRGCAFNPSGGFGRKAGGLDVERVRALQRAGRLDEAAAALDAGLDSGQTAEALHLLGTLELQRRRPGPARPLIEASLALKPEPSARHNLAVALIGLNRLDEARAALEALIAEAPELPSAYLTLSGLADRMGDRAGGAAALFGLAARALAAGNAGYVAQALTRLLERPDLEPARLAELGHRLRLAGLDEAAGRAFAACVARDAGDPGWRLAAAVALLPQIYDSAGQAAAVRGRYGEALEALTRAVAAAGPETLARGAAQVGMAKPFLLSYQGEDDTGFQRAYGAAAGRMMAARWPGHGEIPAPEPVAGRRLRVGFVTYYWHFHSVSKLFGGWVRTLDRARFQVTGYNLKPGPADPWGRDLLAACDRVREAPAGAEIGDATAAWAGTIAADRPDILIYPEIGMETTAVRLAALRLAPVQAMAWGHPVTSGLPTLDYFLSSEFMEPPDGDAHYTERLIRLPGLSIHYLPLPEGDPAPMDRAAAGLGESGPVFVCCQFLPKYRPADDGALVDIARRVPDGRFLFVGDPAAAMTGRLRARLGAAFAAAGLDPARLVFAPPVPPDRFPALLRLGDVYLDSLAWSGGNTALEAAAAGLPMVAVAGRFMRGRHTAGILRALGLEEELVAADSAGYVETAVRLATDARWRAEMAARTLAAAPGLYRDAEPVRALERFLIGAVTSALPRSG